MTYASTSIPTGAKRVFRPNVSPAFLSTQVVHVDGPTAAPKALDGSFSPKVSRVHSPLLTRKEAAKYLGVAVQTLAQWACSGRYKLPQVSIGRKAMYSLVDLDAFITANTHGGSGVNNG